MAMNSRAFPEMLHCMSTRANVAGVKGMEMSVLERQNMVLKRQQDQLLQVQQQHQQEEMSCFNELGMLSFLSAQAQDYQQTMNVECGPSPVTAGAALCELMNRPIKVDPSMETGWMDFGMQSSAVTVENSGVESVGQVNSPCYGMNYAISRTASCPPVVPLVTPAAMTTAHSEARARESLIAEQKLSAAIGRESFKKRKAEKNLMTPKAVETEKDSRSKKRKGSAEEEESKITEQHSNCSQNKQKDSDCKISEKKNKETLGCSSKDDSKASEIQKPDYIHVRARRGQATDSHSLAERVRREKISERMRYLQDLVPGCNKITGKAGMLDEIINYVQSLQRQVEFLSMKLATVNPRLDFNIDDLIAKQVLAACSSSLQTMGVSPDLANHNYLQYSPIQQVDPDCGSELVANQIDMGLRRSISAPVSIPETLFDISCFNQLANSIQWDVDVQNMYNLESQGRSTEFPYQTFTGGYHSNCTSNFLQNTLSISHIKHQVLGKSNLEKYYAAVHKKA